jgi:hypothetical protein
MTKKPEMQESQASHEANAELPIAETQKTDASTRRELIQRYAKYALVAGPMLLFVSKAHAIHSAP